VLLRRPQASSSSPAGACTSSTCCWYLMSSLSSSSIYSCKNLYLLSSIYTVCGCCDCKCVLSVHGRQISVV
jgi:hypothetical protein